MLSSEKHNEFLGKQQKTKKLNGFVKKYSVKPDEVNILLKKKEQSIIKQKVKLPSVVSRPGITLNELIENCGDLKSHITENLYENSNIEQVEIDIKYSGYIEREKENANKLKRLEYVKIPEDIDYHKFSSLSNESKEKLNFVRPVDIGQAARISGIKPSDISILLIYLGR